MSHQTLSERMSASLSSKKALTSGPSNDSGSGSGPSIAHLLDSYFDLMKDSILLKGSRLVSLCHSRSCTSNILLRRCMTSFEMSFPVSVRTAISPSLDILQAGQDDELYVSMEYGSQGRCWTYSNLLWCPCVQVNRFNCESAPVPPSATSSASARDKPQESQRTPCYVHSHSSMYP